MNTVQGDDAYYTLVDREDIKQIAPDNNGDLHFDFSTSGRWGYGNNIDGYLSGEWMCNTEEQISAYAKFISAMKEKEGSVKIEYTDSDTAMEWMGTGVAELSVVDGEISFLSDFNNQDMTISDFAKLQGEDECWALAYLHGDEVLEEYEKYIAQFPNILDYTNVKLLEPEAWYLNIYKDKEQL